MGVLVLLLVLILVNALLANNLMHHNVPEHPVLQIKSAERAPLLVHVWQRQPLQSVRTTNTNLFSEKNVILSME